MILTMPLCLVQISLLEKTDFIAFILKQHPDKQWNNELLQLSWAINLGNLNDIKKNPQKYFIFLMGLIGKILPQLKFTHYFLEFQFKFTALF